MQVKLVLVYFSGTFLVSFRKIKNRQVLEIMEEDIQKLDTFSIDPKSTEFSALINEIVGSCEFLTFDPEDTYG